MGTGGVGGYFGARLACAGINVTFISRGENLEAMQNVGLKIESANGDINLYPVKATDAPVDIGPVDYVLFTTKLWDTEAAGEAIRPLMGAQTAVVSLQNGVDPERRLSKILGREHVMGGLAQIGAVIAAPGVIRHTGTMARVVFGELNGQSTPRSKSLLTAFRNAEVDADISENIEKAIWEKFVFLVGLSGITSVTRRSIGPLRDDADCRSLLTRVMLETIAVARANGIDIKDKYVEDRLAFIDSLPAEMTSSMHQDLERGKRLELDWLSGAVRRMGYEYGLETPANNFIFTALKLSAAGKTG